MSVKLMPPERRLDPLGYKPGDEVLAVGVDPDLHHSGIAVVSAKVSAAGPLGPKLLDLYVVKSPPTLKGDRAMVFQVRQIRAAVESYFRCGKGAPVLLVVEDQGVWSGSTERPKDIIRIAQVAGAACGAMVEPGVHQLTYVPEYSEWAGSLKDGSIFQARAWKKLGEPMATMDKRAPSDPYIFPQTTAARFSWNMGDYKHLGDAVGMAVWGLEVCFKA